MARLLTVWKCYLCPRNARAAGDTNPDYKKTLIFVNDYSAVKEEQAEYNPPDASTDLASSLLRAESATGRCYVLTFSPKHHLTLADMTPAEIVPVIEIWTQIYASHLDPASALAKQAAQLSLPAPAPEATITPPKAQLRYMQIFENKGAAMGCSNPHPHGQIWTTSTTPEEPRAEMEQMAKYRAANAGRHLLADYVKVELEKEERIVFQNETFLVVCPWWAVWPFEVLVLPKRHIRALVDLTAQEREDYAEAIQEVTRRYDNLFETNFPYSTCRAHSHPPPFFCRFWGRTPYSLRENHANNHPPQVPASTKPRSTRPTRRPTTATCTCTSTRPCCGPRRCASSSSATSSWPRRSAILPPSRPPPVCAIAEESCTATNWSRSKGFR